MGLFTAANITAAGEFLGGAGSIASALGFGSKKKGPSQQDIEEAERRMLINRPSWIVQGAKKAGLSPLAVLGASANYSPTIAAGNDKTRDLEQMGQGIARAANAGRTATQRKLDDLAVERAELENDILKTQAITSQRAVASAGSTVAIRSNTDDTGNVEIVPHRVNSKAYEDSGRPAGLPPAFVKYDVGNGQTIELPYTEEGPSEAIENLPLGIDYLKFAELYSKRRISNAELNKKWRRYKAHERSVYRRRAFKAGKLIWDAKKPWRKK